MEAKNNGMKGVGAKWRGNRKLLFNRNESTVAQVEKFQG